MKPRGTTIRPDYVADKKSPWGAWWNEYTPGHTGRPKQRSAWFSTETERNEFITRTMKALTEVDTAPVTTGSAHRYVDSMAALMGYDPDPTKLTGWLKDVRDDREAATLHNYSDLVKNHLAPMKGHKNYPGLGTLIINDTNCNPLVFKNFLTEKWEAGASLSLRKRMKAALSAFMTWAKGAGKIRTIVNPLFDLNVRKRDDDEQEPEPNPLTESECAKFFDHLEAVEDECFVVLFKFLRDVGCRVGEVAALKWTALDLDNRKATIERSYTPTGKRDKKTKTRRVRVVELTDRLVTDLLKWKVVQAKRHFRAGWKQPVYVFTTKRGVQAKPGKTMLAVFNRTAKATGITGHTPHDFRDTFALAHLSVNWNERLLWVSYQLGHATPSTTERHYLKFKPSTATTGFANAIVRYAK